MSTSLLILGFSRLRIGEGLPGESFEFLPVGNISDSTFGDHEHISEFEEVIEFFPDCLEGVLAVVFLIFNGCFGLFDWFLCTSVLYFLDFDFPFSAGVVFLEETLAEIDVL
jgi:hypothetical protein